MEFLRLVRAIRNRNHKNSCPADIPMIETIVKIVFVFLVFSVFASEDSRLQQDNPLCEGSVLSNKENETTESKTVYIPPFDLDNVSAIRNGLGAEKGLAGAVTLAVEPPFSSGVAERLRAFLSNDNESSYLSGSRHIPGSSLFIQRGESRWKNTLLQYGVLSLAEIKEMEQRLDQYWKTIERLILIMDQKVVKGSSMITTEIHNKQKLIKKGHRHRLGLGGWMTATHAVIGEGSWFKVIQNGKQQRATARTGETLLLSEIQRIFALSGKALGRGARHGSSFGERLVIVSDFNLVSEFENFSYFSQLSLVLDEGE